MYTLINAVESHKAYPKTFAIPDTEEIRSLQVGNHAKLGFREDDLAERMWVQITKIEDDQFEGVLDNDPVQLTTITYEDTVTFNSYHILDTLT